MESYKHRCAKEVLAGWLQNDGLGLGTDRVYLEYPICVDHNNDTWGLFPVWDEVDGAPNYFRQNQANIPTYQECIERGLAPLCIFDVAAFHEGHLLHVFEIVHKHPMSRKKILTVDRFLDEPVSTYWAAPAEFTLTVLEAEWVLSQVDVPRRLKSVAQYGCVPV